MAPQNLMTITSHVILRAAQAQVGDHGHGQPLGCAMVCQPLRRRYQERIGDDG
jgi:hypothetical protein